MMIKRYAVELPDGVAIVQVTGLIPDDEALKKAHPDLLSYRAIDPSDIPQDRTFRDAWKADLSVDMEKARVIHMNRIRQARDLLLAKTDIEAQNALLSGEPHRIETISRKKHILRNIPQTFDLTKAGTPDELKALWPDELKG